MEKDKISYEELELRVRVLEAMFKRMLQLHGGVGGMSNAFAIREAGRNVANKEMDLTVAPYEQ